MKQAALIALVLLGACVDHETGLTVTQALQVEITRVADVTPPDLGSDEAPLDPSCADPDVDCDREVEIVVKAIGPDGLVDTSFNYNVQVRAQFLGRVTPEIGTPPLRLVEVVEGVSAATTVTMPADVMYGDTRVWVEDAGDGGTYATGTSPILHYRDPFVVDLQRPADEEALAVLVTSPLEDRQVRVEGSRYGANGHLIVTSIYAQGYTVSDVECQAGGVPPCVAHDYDHVLVFSFSRPRDENFCDIVVGQYIDGFAGAVSEFNGLTEIGFPQTFVAATRDGQGNQNCDGRVVEPAALPPPAHVEVEGPNAWLGNPDLPQNGAIQFERNEGGLISVDTATLGKGFPITCPLDDQFETYKQWELDVGLGCGLPISVITAGAVSSWFPEDHVGEVLTQVVGSLRPVNGSGGFNVWIIYPRSMDDLVP
jgi:hypothetical protein